MLYQGEMICLPILFELRDFHAKFMMALHLANRDRRCLIGFHRDIIDLTKLNLVRGGLHIGYNFFLHFYEDDTKLYDLYKSRDVDFLYFDEEGGVYDGDEEDWK